MKRCYATHTIMYKIYKGSEDLTGAQKEMRDSYIQGNISHLNQFSLRYKKSTQDAHNDEPKVHTKDAK